VIELDTCAVLGFKFLMLITILKMMHLKQQTPLKVADETPVLATLSSLEPRFY